MTTEILVYILTPLAAVVVVLTRLRLARGDAVAGRFQISERLLLLLGRWLPTRGRHADDKATDSWGSGPGLSVLAHVGMLVGVVVFTYAYLTSAV